MRKRGDENGTTPTLSCCPISGCLAFAEVGSVGVLLLGHISGIVLSRSSSCLAHAFHRRPTVLRCSPRMFTTTKGVHSTLFVGSLQVVVGTVGAVLLSFSVATWDLTRSLGLPLTSLAHITPFKAGIKRDKVAGISSSSLDAVLTFTSTVLSISCYARTTCGVQA